MKQLENKVAVVTGGASGIGKAIVEIFAQQGAKVIIADLHSELGNQLIENMGDGNVVFIKADASSPDDHRRMVEAAVENFGALHIAVNSAGVDSRTDLHAEADVVEWKTLIDRHLNSIFYGLHYQLPEIEKVGGSIINMIPNSEAKGFAQSSAHIAAKHGIWGLTQSAGLQYATKGVRVNAIDPGFVSTPLKQEYPDIHTPASLETAGALPDFRGQNKAAELALWLASEKSSYAIASYYAVGNYILH